MSGDTDPMDEFAGASVRRPSSSQASVMGPLVTLIGVILLAYLWPSMFISIRPGEGGVLWYRFLGGTDMSRTYGEGMVLICPWDEMYVYDLTVQQIRVEAPVYTSDGLLLNVMASGRFRADREALPRLHRELGPDYVRKLVEPELVTSVRTVIGRFDSKQVYAKGEQELLDQIRYEFEARLADQDVVYEDVLLVKLLVPEHVQQAIQRKLALEQEALAYEFVLQRELQERQRREIEAEGIARFEAVSGVDILQWRALEVTNDLTQSPNSKVVIMGNDAGSLPVLLNAELQAGASAAAAGVAAAEPAASTSARLLSLLRALAEPVEAAPAPSPGPTTAPAPVASPVPTP